MSGDKAYHEWLKQDFGTLIDAIGLPELQRHFLRSRWLGQVLWMEGKAAETQRWYYILRLTAVIGGVIVPALVSLNLVNQTATGFLRWITFGISLLVAVSMAVEEFLRFGDRWRHYRRTVELLKIEAWRFFQLSGQYRQFSQHSDVYPLFAGSIEETIQRDVDVYITEVVKEAKEGKERKEENTEAA
jgi:hypothetical protein